MEVLEITESDDDEEIGDLLNERSPVTEALEITESYAPEPGGKDRPLDMTESSTQTTLQNPYHVESRVKEDERPNKRARIGEMTTLQNGGTGEFQQCVETQMSRYGSDGIDRHRMRMVQQDSLQLLGTKENSTH